ncbi:MAG: DUF5615 family PIN-like protein [Thermomicrobiales bacterium]
MAGFFLDEDVSADLPDLLRTYGHIVTDVHSEQREGVPDPRQLLFAADRGLTMITHNRRDFLLLHDAWLTWSHEWQIGRRHSGILVVEQMPPADLSIAARAIHEQVSDDDTSLNNTLYQWVRASGWQKSPR